MLMTLNSTSRLLKCNVPLATLPKLNSCISDIRMWMIINKLNVNDSKTEFIVFRSPQANQDFSSLSISVRDCIILQSSKVRDLGAIFDQSHSFDDYISGVQGRQTRQNSGGVADLTKGGLQFLKKFYAIKVSTF